MTKPPSRYSAAPGASLSTVAIKHSGTGFRCHDSKASALCAFKSSYGQLNKLAIDLNEIQLVCGDICRHFHTCSIKACVNSAGQLREQSRRSFKQARLAWAAPACWLLHHGSSEQEAQTESGHQI